MTDGGVLVVGQAVRDLVLRVPGLTDVHGSVHASRVLEQLGGRGANQATALQQLGAEVALLAVLGVDEAGERMLREASAGIGDVSRVVRRGRTALFVELLADDGVRWVLDEPEECLLTAEDVAAAADAVAAADTVCLQLRQAPGALVAAAELARAHGARVVLDGVVGEPAMRRLIALADVVRANLQEAQQLSGVRTETLDDTIRAAEHVLAQGPGVVAFTTPVGSHLVAWHGGRRVLPFGVVDTVDVTGAGDAYVAGLVTGLRAGADPGEAAELASACADAAVLRLGGRPELASLRP